MGEIVLFPIPADPQAACGWLDHLIPIHVWTDDADLGDRCRCGLSVLTIDPATMNDEAQSTGSA